ncbi:MAG: SpoIIIAH-like family protein [Oscillospiraceae bacterium]
MSNTKRNITIAAVLLCVCAAVYLNWSYNNSTGKSSTANGELANAKAAEEALAAKEAQVSDYFAEARLTRQQSRDEALGLLETAASSKTASKETIDSAMSTIAAMASYSMQETQIESLLLAKNFAECVAFMSAEGVTVAVPAPEEGLKAEDVAKITDAIISETDYAATQINLIEVKNSKVKPDPAKQESGKTDKTEAKTEASPKDGAETKVSDKADANKGLESKPADDTKADIETNMD